MKQRTQWRQSGLGLIELLIAMGIGLVLVGAMMSVLFSTRSTSLAQTGMAQLQDDQRLALMMLTNVVQGAGYFPNPLTSTLTPSRRWRTGPAAPSGRPVSTRP